MFRPSTIVFIAAGLMLVGCSTSTTQHYAYKFVPGKTAVLQGRYAIPPANAPEPVKRAIAAANHLIGKPYLYGGGHRRIEDVGYDCSGTASYVLYQAGLLRAPIASDEFRSYGRSGAGDWITLYARRGHVFSVIAGLRLDTGYNGQGEGPQWSNRPRPIKGATLRHPPGL